MKPECGAIILAAGASTRLGSPKQLAQHRGESLLRRSARVCVEAGFSPVIVVFGFDFARMEQEVSGLDVVIAENGDWQSGMASSVRTGINALIALDSASRRTLLMVCDQPLVDVPLLVKLINKSTPTDVSATACSYAGTIGVPAVFARRMWPQLLALEGDQGARRLLLACDDIATVDFSDGAIDVDTPGDLIALRDISG